MKVLIAGDYCPQNRVVELFKKGEFASVLGEIKPIVEQVDYSIVNFECAVCNGDEKAISKCGANYSCSVEGIKALKWVGFDCVTLANNHFFDYGVDGVENTINSCVENGLDYVGGVKIYKKLALFYTRKMVVSFCLL